MNKMTHSDYSNFLNIARSSLPELVNWLVAIKMQLDSDMNNASGQYLLDEFILKHEIIGIEVLLEALSDSEKSSESSFVDLTNRLENYHITDSVQYEFHDYHNHDQILLAATSKHFYQEISKMNQAIIQGPILNKVNGFLKCMVDIGIEFMSKSPLTPMQKNGVDPMPNGQDLNNSLQNENSFGNELNGGLNAG